ncbi:sensor histidine kinase [uncultured Psychroserpens sp.]|uniref:sensor histidine kinase n=1 Tax=uncultured Psychroserpens sp. TaxID=255436 RepID=UPI002618B945|nr:histidine kinase [uncultured Psychroserpens sp.]
MAKNFKKTLGFVALLQCFIAFGQHDKILSKVGQILPYKVLKTSDENVTLEQLLVDVSAFKSPSTITEKTKPSSIYWIQIDLTKELNTISTDSTWYLRFRQYGYTSIFYSENNSVKEKKIGRFENQPERNSILYSQGIPFNESYIFNDKYIYLKIRRVAFFDNVSNWRFYYYNKLKIDLIQNFYSHRDLNRLIPIYLFTGICLVMFLLTIMYYFYSKRTEFLFYALYILFLFLYLTPDIFRLYDTFFGGMNLFSYAFFQISQVIINLCYILYIIYYLNTKVEYPKLHVALKIIATMLVGIIILDALCFATKSFSMHIYLLDIERLIMSLFGLSGMIYLLIKAKSKLAYFIVIGSFLYMIGALGMLFLQERIYMITGASLEILIFAAGLTYKLQQENKERLQFQEEAFLNKTKALRAQINPHFIFNSLSSIQHLVIKNDKVSTLKYLSKFSRLTRNILESSIETNALLSDEIKMLQDYLELESLRFDNAFTYTISCDDTIDANAIEIPFMILQPFVENAIIHGLLPKHQGPKNIDITFRAQDDLLICEVDDNGVGRTASNNKQHIHKRDKKSRGLEVTKQRLDALKTDINTLDIIDKKDKNGASLGTTIIVKIPLK